MPSSRLVAIVTALVLVGVAPGAHAEFTLEQLLEIERYIQSKDTVGLWRYLQSNPSLLEGDDPLAVELQVFVDSMESDLIGNLSDVPAFSERSGSDERDGSGVGFGSFLEGAFAQPY